MAEVRSIFTNSWHSCPRRWLTWSARRTSSRRSGASSSKMFEQTGKPDGAPISEFSTAIATGSSRRPSCTTPWTRWASRWATRRPRGWSRRPTPTGTGCSTTRSSTGRWWKTDRARFPDLLRREKETRARAGENVASAIFFDREKINGSTLLLSSISHFPVVIEPVEHIAQIAYLPQLSLSRPAVMSTEQFDNNLVNCCRAVRLLVEGREGWFPISSHLPGLCIILRNSLPLSFSLWNHTLHILRFSITKTDRMARSSKRTYLWIGKSASHKGWGWVEAEAAPEQMKKW